MSLLPRSLFWRLFGIAGVTTFAALAFAAFAINDVLEHFVVHNLDQQLEAQILILEKAIQPDGKLDETRVVNLPVFGRGKGWAWRVQGPGGIVTNQVVPDEAAKPEAHPPHGPPTDVHVYETKSKKDREIVKYKTEYSLVRQMTMKLPAGTVTITVSGSRWVARRVLRETLMTLLLSLSALGAALLVASFFQLHLGLRPLRDLKIALGEVRAGRLRHVPSKQPTEVAPLASELNALIDQNETSLAHARRHVSNLAHGLKTPLAALSVKLAEDGRDPGGALGEIVAQIDQRVRHHLGRARAAAPGATTRARTLLAPAVTDLVTAMQRIHADRRVAATVEIETDFALAVDPQDLDEMLGNLLDNAWRHARSRVHVGATRVGAYTEVAIEDDGPGLTQDGIRDALIPGRRLDEMGDGHGFGLSITEELAEMNGGSLVLGRSATSSGLRAQITLPAQAAATG